MQMPEARKEKRNPVERTGCTFPTRPSPKSSWHGAAATPAQGYRPPWHTCSILVVDLEQLHLEVQDGIRWDDWWKSSRAVALELVREG